MHVTQRKTSQNPLKKLIRAQTVARDWWHRGTATREGELRASSSLRRNINVSICSPSPRKKEKQISFFHIA